MREMLQVVGMLRHDQRSLPTLALVVTYRDFIHSLVMRRKYVRWRYALFTDLVLEKKVLPVARRAGL